MYLKIYFSIRILNLKFETSKFWTSKCFNFNVNYYIQFSFVFENSWTFKQRINCSLNY